MRKMLFFIFCVLNINVFAQNNRISYEGIVDVAGVSKEELFIRGRQWFNETFRSSKAVLEIQDKESGELSGNFNMKFRSSIRRGSGCSRGRIDGKITLLVKDGKFKYVITDFEHVSDPDPTLCSIAYDFGILTVSENAPHIKRGWGKKWEKNVWADMKGQVNRNIDEMVAVLKQKMASSSNADW